MHNCCRSSLLLLLLLLLLLYHQHMHAPTIRTSAAADKTLSNCAAGNHFAKAIGTAHCNPRPQPGNTRTALLISARKQRKCRQHVVQSIRRSWRQVQHGQAQERRGMGYVRCGRPQSGARCRASDAACRLRASQMLGPGGYNTEPDRSGGGGKFR